MNTQVADLPAAPAPRNEAAAQAAFGEIVLACTGHDLAYHRRAGNTDLKFGWEVFLGALRWNEERQAAAAPVAHRYLTHAGDRIPWTNGPPEDDDSREHAGYGHQLQVAYARPVPADRAEAHESHEQCVDLLQKSATLMNAAAHRFPGELADQLFDLAGRAGEALIRAAKVGAFRVAIPTASPQPSSADLNKDNEIRFWKGVSTYLASCHAATLESLPKSSAKSARHRLRAVCTNAARYLSGREAPPPMSFDSKALQSAVERCEQAATTPAAAS